MSSVQNVLDLVQQVHVSAQIDKINLTIVSVSKPMLYNLKPVSTVYLPIYMYTPDFIVSDCVPQYTAEFFVNPQ